MMRLGSGKLWLCHHSSHPGRIEVWLSSCGGSRFRAGGSTTSIAVDRTSNTVLSGHC